MQKTPKKDIRKNVDADMFCDQHPFSTLTDVHSPPQPPIHEQYSVLSLLHPYRQSDPLQPKYVDQPMQRESQTHSVAATSFVNMLIPPTRKTRQVHTPFQNKDDHPVSSPSSSASTVLTDRSPQSEHGELIESVAQSDRGSWQPCEKCSSEFIQLAKEKKEMEDILSSISKFILLAVVMKVIPSSGNF